MAFQLGAQSKDRQSLQGTLGEFVQSVKQTEANRDATAKPARSRNVTAQRNGKLKRRTARLPEEQLCGLTNDFGMMLAAFRTRDGNDIINAQRHAKTIEARPKVRCARRNADANLLHHIGTQGRGD